MARLSRPSKTHFQAATDPPPLIERVARKLRYITTALPFSGLSGNDQLI